MTQCGETILAERSRRRLRQGDVAKRAKVHVQTIIDIEHNRIGLDDESRTRIISAMDEPEPAGSAAG